jgi:hypothetical protein
LIETRNTIPDLVTPRWNESKYEPILLGFGEERPRNKTLLLARAVVEATGTLPCYWGKDYPDMKGQGCIRDELGL